MAIPTDTKERAIYHMILADMHRIRAVLLQMQLINDADTAASLREHFGREQGLLAGKLAEWKARRGEIYRHAFNDFQGQIGEATTPPE